MSKVRFSDHECPLAQALDEIGDWWTLLVVREVMYGQSRFEAFRQQLGISRAVLSDRLSRLVQAGILQRQTQADDKRAADYSLTDKGRDLWPVIVAMLHWSQRHVVDGDVVRGVSRISGRPVDRICAVDTHGNIIEAGDTKLTAGGDASEHLRARIQAAFDPEAVDAQG
ncbi:MAG: winged helix-turn-helix transcriptional regulator [Parvibaculales bacterium]